ESIGALPNIRILTYIHDNFLITICATLISVSTVVLLWITGLPPFSEPPNINVDAQVICRFKSPDELPRNAAGSIDGPAIEGALAVLARNATFIFNDQIEGANVGIDMPTSYPESIVKCTAVRLSIRGRSLDPPALSFAEGATPL